MTYVKVNDAFAEDDRATALTDKSFRLHVAALCASSRNLTDGVITAPRLAALRAQTKATHKHVNELVLAGLWEGNGPWNIVGYLDLNSSKEQVEHIREERRKAGRTGGLASGESRRADADGKQLASDLVPRLVEPQTETQEQTTANPVVGAEPAGDLDAAQAELLAALNDRDERTPNVIARIIERGGLVEGDIYDALEEATRPRVDSRSAAAVRALQRRAAQKSEAGVFVT